MKVQKNLHTLGHLKVNTNHLMIMIIIIIVTIIHNNDNNIAVKDNSGLKPTKMSVLLLRMLNFPIFLPFLRGLLQTKIISQL